ncbi:MAG: DUF748 domain-containing protein [Syntrophales bacterium]|jgi:hypothetical protein|nr:DUF748 domain-containing protein [Syntrophales bacterium]
MKHLKLILVGGFALLLTIAIVSFLLIPTLARPFLVQKLTEALHRPVTVEEMSFNPFTMEVSLKGITLGNREGKEPLLAMDELRVNVAGFSSLAHRSVILDEILMSGPRVRIVRLPDGTYNFSDLLPKEDKTKANKGSALLGFSLNNILIRGGNIDFDDRPKGTKHKIQELTLDIPFISNLDYQAKRYVEPRFSALINGGRYIFQGRALPFSASREASIDLEIQDLDLPQYLAYIPVKTAFRIPSAKLDAKLTVRFLAPPQGKPTLQVAGRVDLREIAMDDLRGQEILRLPKVEVVIAALEPMLPSVHLTSLTLMKPELIIRRDRKGQLQLANLFPPERQEEQEKKAAPKGKARETKGDEGKLQTRIDRLSMEGGAATILDETPPERAKIVMDPIRLNLEGFSLAKGSKAVLDLDLTLDKKGTIAVKGPIVLDPLDLQLELALRQLPIRTLQPYFADKVRLNIVRGGISATGSLTVAGEKKGPPRINYKGQLAVGDFASRDKAFGNDFVKWRMLSFDGIDTRSQPFRLHIRKVDLRDYFARVIINEDGTLNLQHLSAAEQAPAPEKTPVATKASPPDTGKAPPSPAKGPAQAAAPAPFKDIRIGRVDLDRGTIDYTDRFIKPNYSARMRNMTGSVTGLSSEEITRAAVSLRGNLERGSDILIKGRINPLSQSQYADIAMQFKDIELSPVTPYASKYLGYPILKGKLTFDVSYLVEQGKLNATHKIFIDQLTLGERVESPEAIKAPVSLGVSLLTNRHGQINLDIPVTGNLDDPQFKIWPIVWQIIVNIFTKALTAPFALLASLGGGGEELSYIEFDAGSAALEEAALTKISSLAKPLYEKPNVRLDIEGHVDPIQDREALKKKTLESKVRERKLDDLIETGKPAVPVGQVKLAASEYDKYLSRVYSEANIPKPRNVVGLAKSLPRPEMERLLLEHTAVSDGDLRQLALRRAEAVKDQLLKSGQVEPGRIFLMSSAKLVPEKKGKLRDSRVDFRLK